MTRAALGGVVGANGWKERSPRRREKHLVIDDGCTIADSASTDESSDEPTVWLAPEEIFYAPCSYNLGTQWYKAETTRNDEGRTPTLATPPERMKMEEDGRWCFPLQKGLIAEAAPIFGKTGNNNKKTGARVVRTAHAVTDALSSNASRIGTTSQLDDVK
ncbi:hypothetical protein JTE90_011366 [Oedothorax gibbosus]|uniref:Uncharacterized protein n=1 Tax=Oedothorax gibbosus TaxID=931172 RepID=A0AAV6VM22_9ARAC|nr:hypothetical protein JTE90_011366 [Oedothorax gibbosus]